MNNDEIFAMVLEQALDEEIAECENLPDHKFSRGFEHKMKKLLRSGIAEDQQTSSALVGRRLPIAVIVVIVTFLLMGAAATTYVLWKHFRLQDRGLYTLLHITDVDDCPKTLEERYRLTADLSGFTENVLSDDEILYFIEYENKEKDIKISFQQEPKYGVSKMLNTEDMESPVKVTVNGCKGIYYETKYGSHVLVWDTGDYLIDLGAYNISKNDLFMLAEFVQKVE